MSCRYSPISSENHHISHLKFLKEVIEKSARDPWDPYGPGHPAGSQNQACNQVPGKGLWSHLLLSPGRGSEMLSASGRPNGVRTDGRASPHLCPLTIVCLKEKGTSLPTLFISAGQPLRAQRSRPESLLLPWAVLEAPVPAGVDLSPRGENLIQSLIFCKSIQSMGVKGKEKASRRERSYKAQKGGWFYQQGPGEGRAEQPK